MPKQSKNLERYLLKVSVLLSALSLTYYIATKKTNSFVRFLGESSARKIRFEIIWPLTYVTIQFNLIRKPSVQHYYTQCVLISKGPISKTSQISGFFKQWLVKLSKFSNKLFCSRFISNPIVIFFNSSISKLLLLYSNLLKLE